MSCHGHLMKKCSCLVAFCEIYDTIQVFGSDVDETGDDLVESVLGESPGAVGEAICPPNFIAEAIIDREVVSATVDLHCIYLPNDTIDTLALVSIFCHCPTITRRYPQAS